MSSSTERLFQDAVASGLRNRATIEMARRHCLNMTFTHFGGYGLVEAQTGLPVDMRQVGCLVAHGNTAAHTLEPIATGFYREHCVGCELRRPTGEVPNLATIVEDHDIEAARAAEERQAHTRVRHEGWTRRREQRRGLVASSDPAMAGVLDDIAVLDVEPGRDSDAAASEAALGRLNALAQRAPETFTAEVVGLALDLAKTCVTTTVLTPLRHLARRRGEFARPVLDAALTVLRDRPAVEAGRCVADMPDLAHAEDFDAVIVRHLIYLAEPHTDRLTARRRGGAGDASGLRAAATTVPDLVVDVLRQMLPSPSPPASLVIPVGIRRTDDSAEGDAERGSAAAAVRVLAHTHTAVAAQLITPLILNQGVDSDDEYETEPLGNAQIALATMLVWNVGDVPEQLESAGRAAGAEVRQRLFCVFQQAARLIDPQDRWREPGEPQPDAGSRRKAFTVLMAACLARAGGDWGDECCADAAQTAETLAGLEPGWAQEHLPALLGTVLTVIEEHQQAPTAAASLLLTSAGSPPAEELFWQRMARDTAVGATIRDVLAAVERIAGTDATAVCDAVADMITAERDTENGPTVVRKLLPLLGRVGKCYGDQPGVLRRILPTLHTYILDTEPSLRSAALDAWTEIGTAHPLPSSLSDLLPALLDDRYVVVINAVLNGAMRLEWSQQDQTRLLNHAVRYCTGIDAEQQAKTLKKSMVASWALTRENEELRRVVEPIILVRAGELEPSDLADVLRRDWSPPSARSAQMAALRLRLARDPVINDRFNAHDDEQLCDLLDCGPGLTDLPLADLTQAAVELGPQRLLGAAEFMEVAWRAARPADAAAVMRAVLDITPDQPAYAGHRSLAGMLIAAAEYDAGAAAGGDTHKQAAALDAGLTGLETRIAGQDAQAGQNTGAELVRQGRVRILIRSLLTGTRPTGHAAGRPGADRDPAADLRDRADRMAEAATVLTEVSQKATATGAYLRIFAKLCDIAAQLMRLDAAELDADTAAMTALATACRRRAALLHTELGERLDSLDPLAGPLATAVQQIQEIQHGSDIAALLSSFAALPLPIPVTRGPQRARRRSNSPAEPPQEDGPSIAVVLASVDGQMITGPQVLRTATVYELGLQVQAGPWPQWADRLDAELLSQFTVGEVEAPVYSWQRPPDPQPDDTLTGTGTLILRFALPAGRPAPPFLLALHWRGTRDGKPASQALDVAGHREIRLRPFDASRDYLTSFPVFDERLLALYEKLYAARYNEDHLQSFCRLFTAICRTGLKMTWNKQYRRGARITERKFHDDLYAALQAEPELNGRLERGSPLALGFLDVRHDAITAELKVERTTEVTEERAPKYMGQPTQYAAADGARLSILCILDMSPKKSPTGTPENYLFTLTPALHGLTNPEAPSLVAVIVVNGNLPVPSAWSRRKTALQPPTP